MEIVVKGRNVEVPSHFRAHVTDKLARLERYNPKIINLDVELYHERNRRQLKNCQRVEITGRGRGPVLRAQACSSDFYAALDMAINRLEARLRRFHDRRLVHYGRRSPLSMTRARRAAPPGSRGDGTVLTAPELDIQPLEFTIPLPRSGDDTPGPADGETGPGRIMRCQEHQAEPMTVDEALSRMELVGDDVYLFADAESGRPSVVYRRRGYDYGMMRLV